MLWTIETACGCSPLRAPETHPGLLLLLWPPPFGRAASRFYSGAVYGCSVICPKAIPTGAGAPRVRAVGGIGARSHAWPWVEIPRLGRQQRPISPTNTDPEERAAQSALGLMPIGLRDCGRIGFAGQCAGLAARLNRNRVIGSFLGPVTRSNRLSQGQLFQRSHLVGWLFTFYGYPTTRQRSRSSEKARSSYQLYRWRHRSGAGGAAR